MKNGRLSSKGLIKLVKDSKTNDDVLIATFVQQGVVENPKRLKVALQSLRVHRSHLHSKIESMITK